MTYAQLSVAAFAGMLVFTTLLPNDFIARRSRWLAGACVGIAFFFALACLGFGLDIFWGWSEPFRSADSASPGSWKRTWLGLYALKYWPYLLVVSGGYFAGTSLYAIKKMITAKR
jgi:hypothetical protein